MQRNTICQGSNVGEKLAYLMNWERLVLLDKKKKECNTLGKPASGLKVWLKASFLGPGDRMLCQGSYQRGAETFTEMGQFLVTAGNDATGKRVC